MSTFIIKDGPFRQQRLPAWQPVLTPRVVLPTLFTIGALFVLIGGLLFWSSEKVERDGNKEKKLIMNRFMRL